MKNNYAGYVKLMFLLGIKVTLSPWGKTVLLSSSFCYMHVCQKHHQAKCMQAASPPDTALAHKQQRTEVVA
jgi:hypothetical protein